jgi:hypothetical protein
MRNGYAVLPGLIMLCVGLVIGLSAQETGDITVPTGIDGDGLVEGWAETPASTISTIQFCDGECPDPVEWPGIWVESLGPFEDCLEEASPLAFPACSDPRAYVAYSGDAFCCVSPTRHELGLASDGTVRWRESG